MSQCEANIGTIMALTPSIKDWSLCKGHSIST